MEYWPAGSIADAERAPIDTDPPEPLESGRIPIGKLLCELFAVSIDPYPRNEGDSFAWTPPQTEPETSPFAALAHFRPAKAPKKG